MVSSIRTTLRIQQNGRELNSVFNIHCKSHHENYDLENDIKQTICGIISPYQLISKSYLELTPVGDVISSDTEELLARILVTELSDAHSASDNLAISWRKGMYSKLIWSTISNWLAPF